MSLRVISGTAKGRKLKPVPGDTTRPVMDRVKEALFSILGNFVRDAQFLDLFGGTGSVGIEALSRGAKKATFCELNRAALQTLRENLEHTQLIDRADIRPMDAFEMLRRAPDTVFDYIYVAPPQYKGMWLEALQILDKNPGWLDADGVLVIQINPREKQPVELTHLVAYDERRYGNTLLWFFERVSEASSEPPAEA